MGRLGNHDNTTPDYYRLEQQQAVLDHSIDLHQRFD
jgi:hypothetical protein